MAVCKLSINHFGYRSITLGGLLLLSVLSVRETFAQDASADQRDLPNRLVVDPEIDDPDETEPPAGFVEIQNQTFREDMALEGTGFGLHYSSRRVPGNLAAYQLNIPIYDAQKPPNYDSVKVSIHVAGRTLFHAEDKPLQTPFHLFHWDGLDNQTNPVVGVERVKLDFVFKQTVYVMESSRIGTSQSFGGSGGGGGGGDSGPPKIPYESGCPS